MTLWSNILVFIYFAEEIVHRGRNEGADKGVWAVGLVGIKVLLGWHDRRTHLASQEPNQEQIVTWVNGDNVRLEGLFL